MNHQPKDRLAPGTALDPSKTPVPAKPTVVTPKPSAPVSMLAKP
jgi:hypothetical protein